MAGWSTCRTCRRPIKRRAKIVHRPWFSPDEYKQLYEATRAYAKEPFHAHYKWNAEQVYDFVLFMANTGLRPDEAFNLQHRDVTIAQDDGGKRGNSGDRGARQARRRALQEHAGRRARL